MPMPNKRGARKHIHTESVLLRELFIGTHFSNLHTTVQYFSHLILCI